MNFITEIADKLKFPNEASVYFGEYFSKMEMTGGVISLLCEAMDRFFCEQDDSLKQVIVNLLKSGKNMGLGQGIIVVDENY